MHTLYLEMCSILEVTCLWTCHCWQVSCGSVHRRTLWRQAAKNDGSGVQRCFPRQASDRAAGTRSRTTAVTNPTQGQDHHQGREASLENPAMSLILQCNPKPCNLAFSYSTRNWILMIPLAKRMYGKEISRESSSSGIQSMRCWMLSQACVIVWFYSSRLTWLWLQFLYDCVRVQRWYKHYCVIENKTLYYAEENEQQEEDVGKVNYWGSILEWDLLEKSHKLKVFTV